MSITYYMLKMPPALMFLMIIGAGIAFTAVLTAISAKYNHVKILRAHNEVTGFLFLAIASFYGLLLSFIVLIGWEELNDTRQIVTLEGSSATNVYHDIKYYPDTLASKRLMAVYLDYVYNVVDDEFPKMKEMEPSRKTPESFERVYNEIEHLDPKTPFEVALVAEMFTNLSTLAMNRGLRVASMDTEIPAALWFPILLGALLTILCAIFLDIEHKHMQFILNTMLGAFIGIFLFIIILLDHPYAGSFDIEPSGYLHIFTKEGWSQELHPR